MFEVEFAASYLAGAILTLVIPALVFLGIAIWQFGVARRAHDLPVAAPQPPGTPPPVSDLTAPEV